MNLDLTAAIAAAAHAVHVAIAHDGTTPPYCGGPNDPQRDDAERAVVAAAPLIAAQVAERIAAAIEAEIDMADHAYVRTGMRTAARIAREAVR
jgi:hypothetical protein